jgi:LacI family transcriptional regulator
LTTSRGQPGVSTATVSRCLNAPERVIAATRERVMRGCRVRLAIRRTFGGRALASRRTNTVGAIIPTMENAIFRARPAIVSRGAFQSWQDIACGFSSGYDPAREREQMEVMISRGADGLLLIGSARPESSIEYLHRRGVPLCGGLEPWRAGRVFRWL